MVTLNRVVLLVHIGAACIALLSFWAAVLPKKGSPLHVRMGGLYVRAMMVMTTTAAILATQLAIDPAWLHPELAAAGALSTEKITAATRELGAVLVGVAVLMASLSWQGARAIKRRTSRSVRDRVPDVAAASALVVAGAIGLGLACAPGFGEVADISVVLVAVGLIQLGRLLFYSPHGWLRQHLIGILLSGTLLHAALAVQVGGRVLADSHGVELLAIGAPVLAIGIAATIAVVVSRTRPPARRPRPGEHPAPVADAGLPA